MAVVVSLNDISSILNNRGCRKIRRSKLKDHQLKLVVFPTITSVGERLSYVEIKGPPTEVGGISDNNKRRGETFRRSKLKDHQLKLVVFPTITTVGERLFVGRN
jgi:hypothetical protein